MSYLRLATAEPSAHRLVTCYDAIVPFDTIITNTPHALREAGVSDAAARAAEKEAALVAAQPADGAAPRRLKKGAKKGGEKAARKPLEAAPSTSAPANAPDAAPPAQEKDAPWRRVERPPK